MKNVFSLFFMAMFIVFPCCYGFAGENSSGDSDFKPLSDDAKRKEDLQVERFKKRQNTIRGLVEKIDQSLEKSAKECLSENIALLGDECLQLHQVSDLSEKLNKKIKKMGASINQKCESLAADVEEAEWSRIHKKFRTIREKIDNLLRLCDGGDL